MLANLADLYAQRNLYSVSYIYHTVNSDSNLPEAHVLFDGVNSGLEVGSGCIHVGDHWTHITDDGCKDQHTDLKDGTRENVTSTLEQ